MTLQHKDSYTYTYFSKKLEEFLRARFLVNHHYSKMPCPQTDSLQQLSTAVTQEKFPISFVSCPSKKKKLPALSKRIATCSHEEPVQTTEKTFPLLNLKLVVRQLLLLPRLVSVKSKHPVPVTSLRPFANSQLDLQINSAIGIHESLEDLPNQWAV